MASRRGRGEGSIVQRPDGRWVARIDIGWRNGRRSRKAFYGRTRKQAVEQLTTALRDAQQGRVLPDERQTVGQFLELWLDLQRSRLRERTWATYEQAVRLHLVPGLGPIILSRLTPGRLDEWFRRHQRDGASAVIQKQLGTSSLSPGYARRERSK